MQEIETIKTPIPIQIRDKAIPLCHGAKTTRREGVLDVKDTT